MTQWKQTGRRKKQTVTLSGIDPVTGTKNLGAMGLLTRKSVEERHTGKCNSDIQ